MQTVKEEVDFAKKPKNSVIKSDYKVFVFDLDNTLYLHNADVMHTQIYHEQVKVFLQNLKNDGKILCIATHNKNPIVYLDRIKITSLFHYIISEQKNVHPSLNRIDDYTGKDEMINELISKIGCTNEEILFFDDANYNIKKVESIGVKSILVSAQTGIDFTKLNIGQGGSASLKRKLTIVKNKIIKQYSKIKEQAAVIA
jgi:HAD superfamily phosphatase (TIGR01681 family)